MTVIPDKMLGTEQAAAHLGMCVKTLERMRRDGRGPRFIKMGPRLIRYRLSDLDAWLDAQSRRADSRYTDLIPEAVSA